MRAPFAPPRLSVPRNVAADAHRRCDQLKDRKSGCEDLRFQGSNILLANEFVIRGRNGILPDQRLRGNERAKVSRNGSHIAVRQFKPRPENASASSCGFSWKRFEIFA